MRLSGEVLAAWLALGDHDDTYEIVEGLPESSVLVGASMHSSGAFAHLDFSHPSFVPVPEGCDPPLLEISTRSVSSSRAGEGGA